MPCIEYNDPDFIFIFFQPYFNPFLPFQMVHGIVQIIRDDLFYLKFICPHPHRSLLPKYNGRPFLLQKYACGREYALNQGHDIKLFHHRHVIAEFKGCQGKELFYHLVHLIGLIHDDITVVIPAFRILRHAFGQSFRVSLD